MRARHVLVMAAALVALVGCTSTPSEPTDPAPAASATEGSGGAQAVVDAIAEKWPVPNPQDNTGSCAAKADSSGPGCVKLITTDAVSVYEFASDADAEHWVTGMKNTGDWRQAGRYALAWTARDQELTSKETRSDMVKIAEEVGGEG